MATTIDVEDETILTSVFRDSFPESWRSNPDFAMYLAELSSFGVEKLSREPDRLADERAQVLQQTQELAFHNYKTFIQTADCSREIVEDFTEVEDNVNSLLEKLPEFSDKCNDFMKDAQRISTSRRMTSLTLSKHTQLLEILEIPQLMDTCVRNSYYDEALELASYVRRLEKKHSSIPVIKDIVSEVHNSKQLMLNQLLQQLRSSIQLPACLRLIGYLRRMDLFSEAELRIKFLQARDAWFQGLLAALPTDDAYQHISKVIETSRVHLFDIITQYRAIFSDDDPLLATNQDSGVNEAALFQGWVGQKVSQFLQILQTDLKNGIRNRLDSLLGQCMYFGLSFSRVGADFRGLLAPIFQEAALESFNTSVTEATDKFVSTMQSYTPVVSSSWLSSTTVMSSSSQGDQQLSPPLTLMDHPPLATYTNAILTAFNDLRLCAPLALVEDVTRTLTESLLSVVKTTVSYHRAEESTFSAREAEQFQAFCETIANQLVPYMGRCLQALFPQSLIAQTLGLTVAELQKWGTVGILNVNEIIKDMSHLIPSKETEGDGETLDERDEDDDKDQDLLQMKIDTRRDESEVTDDRYGQVSLDTIEETPLSQEVSGEAGKLENIVKDEDAASAVGKERTLERIDEVEDTAQEQEEESVQSHHLESLSSFSHEVEEPGGEGGMSRGDEGEGDEGGGWSEGGWGDFPEETETDEKDDGDSPLDTKPVSKGKGGKGD
ncbi:Conserved oligomeric Golgi complex subunit 8 [Holothuria leucospilota]|uniref:Conserved oligomeric Golgi complex subunit 8 n=1 Tax=Holothuria leucospilota TaxID=206669 RepID=A0A9Q1H749_HOLLE|nr:Conserved oligomeric Golgi complex subunit 8 [Holothuria leucospilota]